MIDNYDVIMFLLSQELRAISVVAYGIPNQLPFFMFSHVPIFYDKWEIYLEP